MALNIQEAILIV